MLARGDLAARLKEQARPIVERVAMVVSPSCFFKQILLREFKGLDSNRIFVSPWGGVDKCFFRKNQDRTMTYLR